MAVPINVIYQQIECFRNGIQIQATFPFNAKIVVRAVRICQREARNNNSRYGINGENLNEYFIPSLEIEVESLPPILHGERN